MHVHQPVCLRLPKSCKPNACSLGYATSPNFEGITQKLQDLRTSVQASVRQSVSSSCFSCIVGIKSPPLRLGSGECESDSSDLHMSAAALPPCYERTSPLSDLKRIVRGTPPPDLRSRPKIISYNSIAGISKPHLGQHNLCEAKLPHLRPSCTKTSLISAIHMFSTAFIPAKYRPKFLSRWSLVGLDSMLPSPFTYESLPEVDGPVTEIKISDANNFPDYGEQNFARSGRRVILYQTCCLFLGATVIGLLTWEIMKASAGTRQAPSMAVSQLGLNCSDNFEEAKAFGCEFDLLSYSWTPAECFDRQTAAEFNEWVLSDERQLGAWPFFADKDTKQRISSEEALSQRVGMETRTSQEEHLGHCIFWMRRMERVQEGKVRLTARGDGLNHAIHCTASLLNRLKGPNPTDLGKAHAAFVVGFNTC